MHVHAPGIADALAVTAQRGHQPAGHGHQFLFAPARLLADHAQLVIIGHAGVGTADGVAEVVAREHGQLLAGVEDVPHALFTEEAGQAAHVVHAAGGDDGPVPGGIEVGEGVGGGLAHGAGVEARDLVVVLVRGDVAQGREHVGITPDALQGQAQLFPGRRIAGEVAAGGGDHDGLFAQQGQGVGDVARAAAAAFVHAVHHEADAQHVQLVHEHMVLQVAAKGHDAVKSQGTGNINGHLRSFYSLGCPAGELFWAIHARKGALPFSSGMPTIQGTS